MWMIKRFFIFLSLIISTLLFLVFPISCEDNSELDDVWFRDPNGLFHTTELKLAQNEIPFPIIIPTYLPSDIDYPCLIEGPYLSPISDGIKVNISYTDGDKRIFISEQNDYQVKIPAPELEAVYLDIAGIKVLGQITHLYSVERTITGYSYHWNQNRLTFEVDVFFYSADEGAKIVKSMIEQMN